jgi:parallel beta-helix repeat protein
VDNVNIENFTVRNSGGYTSNAGIKLDSKNSIISKCIFYRTKSAVFVNNTFNNEIKNCIFHTNGEGLYIKSSKEIIIKDSYFSNNAFGLNIENSDDISISGCYVNTNSNGFLVYDCSNVEIKKCAVYNNNDNQGGIFVIMSHDVIINNCNIFHNGQGLSIQQSKNIYILKSNIYLNTHTGINLRKNNEDTTIENCDIGYNMNFGVGARSDNTCKFINNNVHDSLFGMTAEYSQIDARRNWWGSIFGPSLFENNRRERLFSKRGRIRYFPWLLFKNRNAGSDWQMDKDLFQVEINNSRYVEIELSGIDSDNDIVPDWWEEKWEYDPYSWDDHKNLDPDGDALSNIEECYTDDYGSNPYIKDIFLELDWIEETDPSKINKPPEDLINGLIEIFKAHSIHLHVDLGELGGGEEIPFIINFTHTEMRDMYWDYFLHNDLNNPRKGIFHYGLLCDYGVYGGFSFVGWDNLDSFKIAAGSLKEAFPDYSRGWVIVTSLLHELGHTLGLTVDDYRGIDNRVAATFLTRQWWKFRNYKSSLNYRYVFTILDYSDGKNGFEDFNDWANLDYGFFKNTHFKLPKNRIFI